MLGNFGRSRHRVTPKEHTNVTFADVAGIEEAKDYGIIMGTVLVYSTLVIGFNLIVDVGYAWLDPRVRVS